MRKHGVEAEELQAYLDGELTPARRAEVEHHLRACRECGALLEDLKRVSATLKQWQVEPAPPGLRPPPLEAEKLRRRWVGWRSGWALAATAAVVLVVALATLPSLQRSKVSEWQEIFEAAPVERADLPAPEPPVASVSVPAPERKEVPKRAQATPKQPESPEQAKSPVSPAVPPVAQVPAPGEADVETEAFAPREYEAKAEAASGVVGGVAGGVVGGRLESGVQTAPLAADEAAPRAHKLRAKNAAVPQMIAYHVSLRVEVKEYEVAKEKLKRMVEEAGGYVAQARTAETPNQPRRADLTLRVPVEQLSVVLDQLRGLGRVLEEQLSTEEVTEQMVDLGVRLRNARATEQRLIAVLNERTGKVGDILQVEREIARIRQEIERLEAQEHNLARRVELATIQVTLVEEFQARLEPAPAGTAGTRLRNAFVEGYENFVGTLLGFCSSLPATDSTCCSGVACCG